MRRKISEEELAAKVVAWLQDQQWDVYQEVTVSGDIADIVAVQNRRVWIIECKTSLSLQLLEQTERWFQYAHWRSAAVPYGKTVGRHFVGKVCRSLGIGIMEVARDGDSIHERIAPSLHRKALSDTVFKLLKPEHKTYANAGNANGHRWTPFKATCREIQEFVTLNPGCNLKTLVAGIQTHYSSSGTARACISHWTLAGKVAGIRCERDGKQLKFYLAPNAIVR